MTHQFIDTNDTYKLCLAAIRSAKNREFEQVRCPLTSKTVPVSHCEQEKKNNKVSCQMCNELMAIRKKYINNLIVNRKGKLYGETDVVIFHTVESDNNND